MGCCIHKKICVREPIEVLKPTGDWLYPPFATAADREVGRFAYRHAERVTVKPGNYVIVPTTPSPLSKCGGELWTIKDTDLGMNLTAWMFTVHDGAVQMIAC